MTPDDLIRNHRFMTSLIEAVVNRMHVAQGKRKGMISRTQAECRYGVANVRYWKKQGIIRTVKGEGKNAVEWHNETDLEAAKMLTE